MHRHLFLLLLLCAPLFSQDNATLEKDIRSALAHSLFRTQPITIEAAISEGGKQVGAYRLIWNSNEDWADRVDIQDHTSLTIAKGDHQYHKRNTPADHPWAILVEEAFEPQHRWHDGSEWKFINPAKAKNGSAPVECGEFEAVPKDHLIVCISTATKDLVSLSAPKVVYSDFDVWNGVRCPRHFTVRDWNLDNSPELAINIGKFGANGKVPAPEVGMEETPNCAPAALKGGRLKQRVTPDYPAPARLGRIQGAVWLVSEIRPDGSVNIKSVTGHPMLAQSARAAVSAWKYEPFSCNGTPVAMPTVITVNYLLAGF